ncbi:MAG: hypothetical protein IPG06_13070 [Haliea sp.]|nr:hypothetical protein [Haliea sp.]
MKIIIACKLPTQHYSCVMIPTTTDGYLPPGEHQATWAEVVARFGGSPKRDWLLTGLQRGITELHRAGCLSIYIDGSFVTDKPEPGDFDVAWDAVGVDGSILDPVLLDFDNGRLQQKLKYRGEFFPSHFRADLMGTIF